MENVYCNIGFFFSILHYVHVFLILYIPYNLIIILTTTDIVPVCDIVYITSGLKYRRTDRKQTTTYPRRLQYFEHILKN